MSSLILKRASTSRPSGEWSDDDYDVLEDAAVVGRIFLSPAAPNATPWMWESGHSADSVSRAAHGYEPTREAVTAAFTSTRLHRLLRLAEWRKRGRVSWSQKSAPTC